MAATPPVIQPGKKLDYTSRPFRGGKRVNFLIALFNAMNNLRVKVVSTVGTTGSSPSALNNITPAFSFDSTGNAVLTIPVTTQASQQGWFWVSGSRNYNPANSYMDQQLVYVQPTSAAATTGILNRATLSNVKSVAGIWVCLQATAPTVISGTTYYDVPQLPMPVPGDMDSGSNFWALVSQDPLCV